MKLNTDRKYRTRENEDVPGGIRRQEMANLDENQENLGITGSLSCPAMVMGQRGTLNGMSHRMMGLLSAPLLV